MNTNVLLAVFRRNFVSYFASPTGYVFICVFVLLSTFVAFWSPEFFNANLANLDQLNFWFPFIMLVFIPTITMGIWAEERRQGTDELLLTIPADDFDIVLGKYLAAVAIYTVSLVFSLICNYAVLRWLGDPDVGLLLATYVGYWLVGLAMLAVGMVASFLTANLTIGFILGLIFNLPLVFAVEADVIFSTFGPVVVLAIKRWSVGQEFYDFGRGVLSLSGLSYFVMVAAVMLYVGMVLIGRRHWFAGQQRQAMVAHYVVRVLALVVIAVGINIVLDRYPKRLDATAEQLSSLSPRTEELLANLKLERPVQIEAFISPTVPEVYVQTRLNLRTMLRELEARGGGKVRVRINDTERFSEEAALAERRFGITPRTVTTVSHGALSREQLFMGVAMTCGLQKVILPFIDRGIPVEYELVRSIATISQQGRKKLGVLNTDAQLYGRFNMQTFSPGSNWAIIDELEKQYDVEQVDPSSPIAKKYDVLLAVQPSSLGPEEMDHFIAAIESGQPTAIFEDPCPVFAGGVPATSRPRQPPGGMNMMFMGGQQAPPKGDIEKLWRLLGVNFGSQQVIWQDYNPFPKASQFPKEFVFVDYASRARFNPDCPISAKLQHMLFPFPGSILKLNSSALRFQSLVKTGDKDTGTVRFDEIMQMSPFGPRGGLNPNRRLYPTNDAYVLAAEITGKLKPSQPMADDDGQPAASEPKSGSAKQPVPGGAPAEEVKPETTGQKETAGNEPAAEAGEKPVEKKEQAKEEKKEETTTKEETKKEQKEEKPKEAEINVVLVADIDMLTEDFFRLREQGEIPEAGIHFDFDNVTFVLNLLDSLAGDQRFVDIRSRRPKHRTLTRIEQQTEAAKQRAGSAREEFIKEYEASENREQKALDTKIEELRKRKDVDPQQLLIEVALAQQDGQRRLQAKTEQFRQKRDRQVNQIETDLALQIRRVQDQYKLWAVVLPPIPPLLLAVVVFINRRIREREGVARSRLR
jgi:ABC-2 type transport system permease protein